MWAGKSWHSFATVTLTWSWILSSILVFAPSICLRVCVITHRQRRSRQPRDGVLQTTDLTRQKVADHRFHLYVVYRSSQFRTLYQSSRSSWTVCVSNVDFHAVGVSGSVNDTGLRLSLANKMSAQEYHLFDGFDFRGNLVGMRYDEVTTAHERHPNHSTAASKVKNKLPFCGRHDDFVLSILLECLFFAISFSSTAKDMFLFDTERSFLQSFN